MMEGGLLNFLIEPRQPEPPEKQFEQEFAALASISELVDEAYRNRLPVPAGWREDFGRYVDFCAEVGANPMTSGGPIVAMFLMEFANEPRPYTRMCRAVDAIEYFIWLHRKTAYVQAVLEAASIAEVVNGESDGETSASETETIH